MGTQNADLAMLGPVAVYYGTAGQEPATSFGYTDDNGVEVTPVIEVLPLMTGQAIGAKKRWIIEGGATFKMNLVQPTLEFLAKAIPGASLVGSTISFSNAARAVQELSLKLVGLSPEGYVRTYKALYVSPTVGGGMKLAPREWVNIPCEFETLSTGTNAWEIIDGDGTEVKTLDASGEFAFVSGQTWYKLGGAGNAADALTDITGTIPDGQLVILQIQTAAEPITVTHAADKLELDGAADWVMDNVEDVLWLQYNLSLTKWVEYKRFNA
jgi:hypothetical protein